MSEQVEQHILKRYNLMKKVGSGAYGHVWKVTDRKTGNILALKKIFDAFQHSTDAQRTYRQIVFLHELDHSNIIKLHNVFRAQNDKDLYLVFEYMQADLHNAINQKILKDIHNRYIMYQLVKGMKFLHSSQLLHRDLKPSNILLNSDCSLKICDFGLARSLTSDREGNDIVLTQQVATRWYRAPEVLLGSQSYDKSADIWSIGCIFGEMLTGKPLFPGNSTLNQLQRILSFTGKPKRDDIYALQSEIAETMIQSIPEIKSKNLGQWFKPQIPNDAINLLQKILHFNPKKRLTMNEILKHPYLSKFSNPKEEYESKKIIQPPISDNKKLNLKQYRELIYDRIKKIYKEENKDNKELVLKKQEPEVRKVIKSQKSEHIQPQKYSISKENGNKQSSLHYQSNSQNSYTQKIIKKDTQKAGVYSQSFHKQYRQLAKAPQSQQQTRNNNTSLKQNSYIPSSSNSSCHLIQRHSNNKVTKFAEDSEIKKKNSLKEFLKNKKQYTFKEQSNLHNQKYISPTSFNSLAKYYKAPMSQISK